MSTIVITVDSKKHDRLVASMVQAMRQSLGVTVAQLAKASGIPRPSIEAIERGGTTTRAERHEIKQPGSQGSDDVANGQRPAEHCRVRPSLTLDRAQFEGTVDLAGERRAPLRS